MMADERPELTDSYLKNVLRNPCETPGEKARFLKELGVETVEEAVKIMKARQQQIAEILRKVEAWSGKSGSKKPRAPYS